MARVNNSTNKIKTTKTMPKKTTPTKRTYTKRTTVTKTVPKKTTPVKTTKVVEVETKPSEFMLFFSFIVSLIVVVGLIYFVYIKFIKISDVSKRNVDMVQLSSQDINTLGANKYNWMLAQKDVNGSYIFFNNKMIDINSISMENVLSIAYHSSDLKDRLLSGNCKDINNCEVENFSKGILQEQIINNFSNKLKINYIDFKPTATYKCNLSGDYYTCDNDPVNINVKDVMTFGSFYNAEIVDNKLIVYSTVVAFKVSAGIYDDSEKGIYPGNNLNKRIDDLTEFRKIETDLSHENITNLINKYKSKLPVYKSTFVLENNNYVWEKTEIE